MSDISGDFVDTMRAHAAEAHPREACGVLVGPADECRFERLIPMRNTSDRTDEYSFDPDEQLAVWQALEDLGERVWGIYHSHPTTTAYPSKMDVATAQPDMLYVIVGFDREVRAFRIVNGQVVENPLRIKVAATPGSPTHPPTGRPGGH